MRQKALELYGTLNAYHPILTLIRMRGRWGKRLQIYVSRRQLLCVPSCTDSHQNAREMGQKASGFRGTLSLCMPSYTESDQREGEMGQKALDFHGTLSLCMPSHTESDQREGEMGQKASGFRGERHCRYAIVY